jgi:hypothetical protein
MGADQLAALGGSLKTIVVVVSVGTRDRLTDFSYPRIAKWASRNQYTCALIKHAIQPQGRPPHYAKLLAHRMFPGFDRYCVVDDDILISSKAPPLPEVPAGHVGLVKDEVQTNTTNPIVGWTGNTGFLVFDSSCFSFLEAACDHGDEPTVWGFADQGALNYILWQRSAVFELDGRWNYPPIIAHFSRGVGWHVWSQNRFVRLAYYVSLILNPLSRVRRLLKQQWGIHLIRAPYTKLFDRHVP